MTKVLIVEDDPAILRGLADNLKFEKYDVLTATDGEAGYKLQHTQNPDLIVLDLMLPRMTGLELCRKLRTEGRQVPILMLTARGEEAIGLLDWTSVLTTTSQNLSRSWNCWRGYARCCGERIPQNAFRPI